MKRNHRSEWLRGAAFFFVVVVAFALVAGAFMASVALSRTSSGPATRYVCGLAEFHPDVNTAQRKRCRELRSI